MAKRMRVEDEFMVETQDEESEDDIVITSRRKQYVVETPEAETSETENEVILRVPGAPEKKRRRVLPWTKEGIGKFGPLVGKATGSDEESDDDDNLFLNDGWVHGQTGGNPRSSVGLESEDDCKSFVVADDSDSVVAELEKSERDLGRASTEEVRDALEEQASKLERKLESVYAELARVEEKLEKASDSSDSGDEVVDEVYGRTRRGVALETCYPFE